MQRVAIARALVNNPNIILADEPTGALDSKTSVQVMEILKEIAKEKLIIMVTHNSQLAEQYSSRIVKLSDGEVIEDTDPYTETGKQKPKSKKKQKKISMSFFTALSLSMNNLLTKKGRTILTAFAGSIGIIGIAAILSLSNGIQRYIARVEEDTLSSSPIVINEMSAEMGILITSFMEANRGGESPETEGKIYSREIMSDMMRNMSEQMQRNNLEAFKEFLEGPDNPVRDNINAIQYTYNLNLNVFRRLEDDNFLQVNPNQVLASLGMGGAMEANENMPMGNMGFGPMGDLDVWQELIDNETLLRSQHDILAGRFPENHNEVVLIVNQDNTVSDFTLYALGLRDINELTERFMALQAGEELEPTEPVSHTLEELLELEFRLLLNTDFFEREGNTWVDRREDPAFMQDILENAETIQIVGIIRANEENVAASMSPGIIGYTRELKTYVINRINEAEIVIEQKANPETNIFTGGPFTNMDDLPQGIPTMMIENYSSLESNLRAMGVVDLNRPQSIRIFPVNFEGKDNISNAIEEYNQRQIEAGREEDVISYTDIVGAFLSGITSIINIVTYVLIAFVAISLVVSSIMIGIITYISVLERTKEIGILRSIGASKRDVSRVFNAETFIVGLIAGLIGIGITALLTIPANIIIHHLTGVSGIARLPIVGAIALILISMLLTIVAGLIPAKMASKKDPVIALRTE